MSDRKQDLVRRAFEGAESGREPDIGRLMEAVPAMMAEAARRRRLAEEVGPMEGIVRIGRRVLPALAAATAILLATASFLVYIDSSGGPERVEEPRTLDRLILTGGTESGSTGDLLMQAIVEQENGNG